MVLFMNFGILLSFIAGTVLDYFTMPLVMLIVPTIYVVLVLFLPDTPHSLIKRHKVKDAANSLVFYRSSKKVNHQVPYGIKLEFELIKSSLDFQHGKQEVKFRDFSEYHQNFPKIYL